MPEERLPFYQILESEWVIKSNNEDDQEKNSAPNTLANMKYRNTMNVEIIKPRSSLASTSKHLPSKYEATLDIRTKPCIYLE